MLLSSLFTDEKSEVTGGLPKVTQLGLSQVDLSLAHTFYHRPVTPPRGISQSPFSELVWHGAIISVIINEDLSLKVSQGFVLKERPS